MPVDAENPCQIDLIWFKLIVDSLSFLSNSSESLGSLTDMKYQHSGLIGCLLDLYFHWIENQMFLFLKVETF